MIQLGISLIVIFSIIAVVCFSIFRSFHKAYKQFDDIKDTLLDRFPMYNEEIILNMIIKTKKYSIIIGLISLLLIVCGILFIIL